MSARGGGRGGGRGGAQPSPNAGRGPQSGRGGGRRGRGGGGNNAPPPYQPSPAQSVPSGRGGGGNAPAAPYRPAPAPVQSVVSVAQGVEKLSIEASSSTATTQTPNPPQKEAITATLQGSAPAAAPASSKALRNPLRPGIGTFGQKIIVRANHFLVTVADRDLHHYDVSISPEVASKKVCRDIMKELVKCYQVSHLGKRMLAYDGRKSCYTAGQLPFVSKEFNVKLVDKDGASLRLRERDFKVSIKFASKADLHHLSEFLKGRQHDVPQETLQFLDVVLREKPSNSFEVVGRSFFSPLLGSSGELGNGLEYWKGFYQSLRPTQMGLSLNIDMSARAFFEPILVSDYVAKYLNKDPNRPLSDQDRIKIKKALRGVKVEINHPGHIRRHKILGITTEPVKNVMFTLDDSGAKISVEQYFRQKYNIVLKCPNLPAIQAGNVAKPISLPMEVCKIVGGQRYSKKLNERQVTALLRATCQRPSDREKSINEMQRQNNYNNDALVNKEFGINDMAELIYIEYRVIPPPMMSGGRLEEVNWPRESEAKFIVLCHQEYLNGQLLTTCFSRPILSQIGDRLNSLVGGNMRYEITYLKTKWKNVKRAWKLLYELRFTRGSGLGWDHEKETIVGTFDQLEAICAEHRNNKGIIKRGLPRFDLCTEMFNKKVATGTYSRSSMQPPSDNEAFDNDTHVSTLVSTSPSVDTSTQLQSAYNFTPDLSSQDAPESSNCGRTQSTCDIDEYNTCLAILQAMEDIPPHIQAKAEERLSGAPPPTRRMFLQFDEYTRCNWLMSLGEC